MTLNLPESMATDAFYDFISDEKNLSELRSSLKDGQYYSFHISDVKEVSIAKGGIANYRTYDSWSEGWISKTDAMIVERIVTSGQHGLGDLWGVCPECNTIHHSLAELCERCEENRIWSERCKKMKLKMFLPESDGFRHIRITEITEDAIEAEAQFGDFDSTYGRIKFKASDVFLLFRKIAEYDFPRRADSRMRRMAFRELVDQYHAAN